MHLLTFSCGWIFYIAQLCSYSLIQGETYAGGCKHEERAMTPTRTAPIDIGQRWSFSKEVFNEVFSLKTLHSNDVLTQKETLFDLLFGAHLPHFKCLVCPHLVQAFVYLFSFTGTEQIGQVVGLSVVDFIDPDVAMAQTTRPCKWEEGYRYYLQDIMFIGFKGHGRSSTVNLSCTMLSYLNRRRVIVFR